MIMTLTEADFINLTNEFSQHKDNFSYKGKKALFQYIGEFEEDTGEEIEFDYIALCVDYSEYDNLDEVFEVYDLTLLKALTITELREHTEVIEFYKSDSIDLRYKSYIIRNF